MKTPGSRKCGKQVLVVAGGISMRCRTPTPSPSPAATTRPLLRAEQVQPVPYQALRCSAGRAPEASWGWGYSRPSAALRRHGPETVRVLQVLPRLRTVARLTAASSCAGAMITFCLTFGVFDLSFNGLSRRLESGVSYFVLCAVFTDQH